MRSSMRSYPRSIWRRMLPVERPQQRKPIQPVQLSLHRHHVRIALAEPNLRQSMGTYRRSGRYRPTRPLSYEHMFSSRRTSEARRRALDALGLIRSFLLLEDDYEVDWEVGQEELCEVDHPHRAALRTRAVADRLAHRRIGQPTPRPHICLSPVDRPARSHQRQPARREGSAAMHCRPMRVSQ